MYTPAFFTKWLLDLASEQHTSGSVTYTVPNVHGAEGGAAGWADAALIVPWNLYQYYGDTRILERQYSSMKAWVEFMRSKSKGYLWLPDNRQFGDWLSFSSNQSDYPGAYTEKDLICSAFFAYSTGLLRDIAGILGYKNDADEYAALFDNIKQAYIKEFVTPAGRISSATQTAYVLSLYFDLLPEHLTSAVARRLADNVKSFGHITTGFLGTNLLCHVLSAHGYTNEAYLLLNRKEYPSWLYPVTMGATTIWERWDGIKPDGSFQDPGMNSFNHYAYGAVGDWLYRSVAGLNQKSAGYKTITIKPEPGGGLNYAKVWYESMYGLIESAWKIKGDKIFLDVIIPPNTTAEVYIPSTSNEVLESGKRLHDIEYLKGMKRTDDYIIIEVGSGSYSFEYQFASEK
jgi:alpha-L-rhamnosidase